MTTHPKEITKHQAFPKFTAAFIYGQHHAKDCKMDNKLSIPFYLLVHAITHWNCLVPVQCFFIHYKLKLYYMISIYSKINLYLITNSQFFQMEYKRLNRVDAINRNGKEDKIEGDVFLRSQERKKLINRLKRLGYTVNDGFASSST
uniref:Uncharacterized protein n=1 Tax=Tetranychus urticae TaxID=32264 RepID=A0A158P4H0_TETUR